LRRAGAEVGVAYGLDHALRQLERWRLLRGRSSAQHFIRNTSAAPARDDARISRGGHGCSANGMPSQRGTTGIVPSSAPPLHQPGAARRVPGPTGDDK
jgi:hypothetical protein